MSTADLLLGDAVTIPTLARDLGADESTVRKTVDRLGLVRARIGYYRLVHKQDIPRLQRELRARGCALKLDADGPGAAGPQHRGAVASGAQEEGPARRESGGALGGSTVVSATGRAGVRNPSQQDPDVGHPSPR
jgi:hypothetical protein